MPGNPEADEVFLQLSGFDKPPVVTRSDRGTDDRRSIQTVAVDAPGTLDIPADLVIKEALVDSSDGAELPVFVCHRADLDLDGDSPALLDGYGGFRNSVTPEFDRFRLPFLADGGVYAQVSARSGLENGQPWHEAGMLAAKHHPFDHFVAAGEYLCEAGYTNPDRLGVAGESNGGLSVSAVVTRRPDLWGAAVCAVPEIEMLRFHRFLRGESWTTEYGHPADPADFETLRAYSSYYNVDVEVSYPPVLFTTAVGDTRVHPAPPGR